MNLTKLASQAEREGWRVRRGGKASSRRTFNLRNPMHPSQRISNTRTVNALRITGSSVAFPQRTADGYIFTNAPLKNVETVRRAWQRFTRQYPNAEEHVHEFDPANPNQYLLNAWRECVDTMPAQAKINIFGRK